MHALTWLNASSTYFSFRNLMTMFLIVIVGSSLMCHLCVFPFYFEKSMQIRRSQTSLVSLVIIMSWVGSRNISFMPAQHSDSALRVLPLLWSCDADRGYQSWEPLHSLVTERGQLIHSGSSHPPGLGGWLEMGMWPASSLMQKQDLFWGRALELFLRAQPGVCIFSPLNKPASNLTQCDNSFSS